jgi:hypothetical protein
VDQPAKAVYNDDGKIDPDDIIQFILHDTPGATPGNIFATNTEPVFQFNSNLEIGKTYYISAIAGNNIGGTVDLNDACLSVAPGTAIRWKALPDASFTGDSTICAGESVPLFFSGTGDYPLTCTIKNQLGQLFTAKVDSLQNTTIIVSPSTTTLFTLLSVQDGTMPSCTTQLTDSVTIIVQQPAAAGASIDTAAYCANDFSTIDLADHLVDADTGGFWLETSPKASEDNAFDAASGTFQVQNQAPGLYTFMYYIDAQLACPADSAEVQILVRKPPVADAGPEVYLDCFIPTGTLGSMQSSTGNQITYAWSKTDAPVILSDSMRFTVDQPGHYVLHVRDEFGCTAVDSVLVIRRNTPISVAPLGIYPIRCYGEANGVIQIDSVSGGKPPVLFSLNGAPFSNTRLFQHLPPGKHVLVAQDVEGCEWIDTVFLQEPAEIKIELGPDIEAALGDSVYLWLQSSVPKSALDTILWNPLLDTVNAGTFQQSLLPVHSGKIAVTVIDTNGCIAWDAIVLRVDRLRRVYIPNVFKPDATTEHVFEISFGTDVRFLELLEIFDRWGELIYQVRNVSPQSAGLGWDGTYRGQRVTPGVYLVHLVLQFQDGESEVFTGNVTILR